jgi:NADH-quinone oxidoreductase subunit N
MPSNITDWNWLYLAPLYPELILAVAGLLLLMVGAFRGPSSFGLVFHAAVASLLVAGAALLFSDWTPVHTLGNMIVLDGFSGWMGTLIIGGLVASLALAYGWLKEHGVTRFEYPILVMFAGIGMMLMTAAHNLLAAYVSLELSSLSLYVLASIHRDRIESAEAGLKYFLLGALSSGLLLFGMSLVYGFTGSLDYEVIGKTLAVNSAPTGAIIGLVFILAGIAFKISAVPFHMWTPDVYQGAPTPVAALFAIVPKVAAFGMLLRMLTGPFESLMPEWSQILLFVSVASMLWGAFAGLVQEDLKRLLAYSSIGNMGYAMLGVLAGIPEGMASVILYISIYMVMTAGVFAILMCLRRDGQNFDKISDLAGISKTSPFMAYVMVALMFSMSGIPPLAGFFGKLFVFESAIAGGYFKLAVVGVLTSVIAAYYYLRVIKVIMFDEPAGGSFREGDIPSRRYVALASLVFALVFIVMPNRMLDEAMQAASALFP